VHSNQKIVESAQMTESRFTNQWAKVTVVYKQLDTWILGGNYESNTQKKNA